MATALLHSLLVQDKLGHLKRLSIILSILGFFLCFFGTFITWFRCHQFHTLSESPIGENYLFYLLGVMVISIIIYMASPEHFTGGNDKVWGF